MVRITGLKEWTQRYQRQAVRKFGLATIEATYQNEAIGNKPIVDMTARELGIHGELVAFTYLKDQGLEIVERNWTNPFGEVDIVARDYDGTNILVEVKTRRVPHDHMDRFPEMAVGKRKRDRYRKMGLFYLADTFCLDAIRFDVIAINVSPEHSAVRHVVGAFAWED